MGDAGARARSLFLFGDKRFQVDATTIGTGTGTTRAHAEPIGDLKSRHAAAALPNNIYLVRA